MFKKTFLIAISVLGILSTTFSARAASISITPSSSIDFGNVESDTQFSKDVTIKNTGSGNLSIKYELDNTTDFEVNPTPDGIPAIPAGQTAVLKVIFKSADSDGTKSALINIIDKSNNAAIDTISLTGKTTPGQNTSNGGNTNGGSISMTFPCPLGSAEDCTVANVVKNVINGIFGLLGAIAVIMIVYGGVIYMTGGSSKDGAEKGKKIITSAVIGLVIVLLSLAIIDLLFVLLGGR